MVPCSPCRICDKDTHAANTCPELYSNKPPPPQRGGHGDDEDDHLDFILTSSGNLEAHDVNQTNGSNAGHWNPLSVINMYTQSEGFRFIFII